MSSSCMEAMIYHEPAKVLRLSLLARQLPQWKLIRWTAVETADGPFPSVSGSHSCLVSHWASEPGSEEMI